MNDFEQLAQDLTEVAGILTKEVRKSVKQTGFKTRDEYRKAARGNPLGRQYTDAIDFTTKEYGAFGQGVFEVEIGPNLERYGGKTGRGGLVPSAGIFDDPNSPVSRPPDRARRRAEKFGGEELVRSLKIAIDRSHEAKNL